MIPGIINSRIFSEQGKLVFRAVPWQSQFAGTVEAINNCANGCGLQITAANFPRRAKGHLFALQETCLHQPFDRAMTDAAYSSSLAQTNSLQIR